MRSLAMLFLVAGTAASAQDCPLKPGDPLDMVKRQFGLDEPARQAHVTPGGTASQYHLAERGIWIFFDSAQRVTTLRFEAPFAGRVGGVGIGDSREVVRVRRGEPQSVMQQGMPDMAHLAARRRLKQELLDRLPDPAPKAEVRRAFEEMARIDAEPLRYMTGWIYRAAGSPDFTRYDFGSSTDRVQIIFTRGCY